MERRKFSKTLAIGSTLLGSRALYCQASDAEDVSVGIIGLDTSHAPAFTKIINNREEGSTGFKVTHAYPHGSRDIESSSSRIPKYTEEMKGMGVRITDSIASMLNEVEVVLLETNDGRLHLEQSLEVFEAGKRVFIDKPMAASLSDTKTIFREAHKHNVPTFSASSLRFSPSTQSVASGSIGSVLGADTYSPAKLETTHPDLYWYGIHGVESLYTVMGKGCKKVTRIFRDEMEVVNGEWEDGRIGTFRGIRTGKTGYGGVAFGTEGIAPVGAYEGYEHLVVEILEFFRTGKPPVDSEETIEIFAFMSAADLSRERRGAPVDIEEVMG